MCTNNHQPSIARARHPLFAHLRLYLRIEQGAVSPAEAAVVQGADTIHLEQHVQAALLRQCLHRLYGGNGSRNGVAHHQYACALGSGIDGQSGNALGIGNRIKQRPMHGFMARIAFHGVRSHTLGMAMADGRVRQRLCLFQSWQWGWPALPQVQITRLRHGPQRGGQQQRLTSASGVRLQQLFGQARHVGI